jgi:uncharacterized protein
MIRHSISLAALSIVFGLIALSGTVRAASPSFNCGARLNATEVRICANPTLADLDRRMADTYFWLLGRQSGSGRNELNKDQRN